MNQIKKLFKNRIFLYTFALLLCFCIGIGITRLLYLHDQADAHPAPIQNGQMVDFSAFGFTLEVPESYTVSDLTEGNLSMLTLLLGNEEQQFYIYCYSNDSGDDISQYSDAEMVRYYMQSGCDRVTPRELGGRPFITYRAAIESLTGDEYWYVYETWDPEQHMVIETQMLPGEILPILVTLTFA